MQSKQKQKLHRKSNKEVSIVSKLALMIQTTKIIVSNVLGTEMKDNSQQI